MLEATGKSFAHTDDLLNYVFKQIDSLKRLVTYIADEDWELASNEAAMIGTFESLADDAQQKASLRICRGAFFSGLSEHFLELLEKIDDMADFAKDASTAATEINLRTPVFHSLLKDQDSLYNMIEEVTQSAKALKVAIESLTRGSDPVIKGHIGSEEAREACGRYKRETDKESLRSKVRC